MKPDLNPGLSILSRRFVLRLGLLLITGGVVLLSLISPIAIRPSSYIFNVGDVVSQDITAPYNLNFVSNELTNQALNQADQAIQAVYLPVDPSVTRRQIERLKIIINFISTVRADTYSNVSQKKADLNNFSDVSLSDDLINKIIGLSDARWQTIAQETPSVLEQVMRNTIRESNLEDAKRSISTLISFSIPQDQTIIITDLVSLFIVPNSLYSAELTAQARKDARDAVKPVQQNFLVGESIVRRGQIITPLIYEVLGHYGLLQQQGELQNILAASSIVLILTFITGLYFSRRKLSLIQDARSLIVIACLFILFLFGARYVIPNRAIVPYLFPLGAFGFTVGSLFNLEVGVVLSLILSILAAFNLPNALDLTVFYITSSFLGIIVLGKGQRVINFFWAGLSIGVAGSLVILAYRLTDSISDWIGIATLIGASFINGLASASLTLLFQFLFAQLLGVATAMQLLDLSRPDHPLLQFLLRNAPGTYQHSLQVSNLAEQAAEAIGADSLLVRVGCLYHDVGKATNPSFFVENQVPGKLNPHDDMAPEISAATIIRHVGDGVQLAKKHRIPSRIQDFMREHHGSNLTRYQYIRAVQAAGNDPTLVDKNKFRYPGPRPRTRETALLMLADGCEARSRAELPKDAEELAKVVRSVFEYLQQESQLDETVLTLRDLHRVQESFIKTLKNTYHPRIQYPVLQQNPPDSESQPETSLPSANNLKETT
jgi:putative nucleotidyltransferase with HDIG domain